MRLKENRSETSKSDTIYQYLLIIGLFIFTAVISFVAGGTAEIKHQNRLKMEAATKQLEEINNRNRYHESP